MIDRLVSGAGALSHLADRAVRLVARDGGLAHQPAGLLLAALLGVGALVAIVLGVEVGGDRTPRVLTPAEIADGDLGDRVYTTVTGGLTSAFVETYFDENDEGQQQPEERGVAWDYFLVDPTSHAGVTVRSQRPPSAVFTFEATGVVVDDPAYVAEDAEYFRNELAAFGVTLDPTRFLDATGTAAGAPYEWADELPAAGTAITVRGSRGINFFTVCTTDTNNDGVCSEDEGDLFDVYVYDPVSKRALTVLTANSPEFAPMAFTGVMRSAPQAVEETVTADGASMSDFGIRVSTRYLLTDGDTPADPGLLFGLAGLAAVLAVIVVLGVAGGYLRFRPGGAMPPPAATMAIDERIPIRVTGNLRTPGGLVHVREAAADLQRFGLVRRSPTGSPPSTGEPEASTLIIERRGGGEGVAVGRGELTAIEAGKVTPLRGDRPALRLTSGTGPILVSFDSVEARDRASAELATELAAEFGVQAPSAV